MESVYFEASVPSTRTLLDRQVIAPADVLWLRKHPATAAFRRWLWRADNPNDGPALAADYVKRWTSGSGYQTMEPGIAIPGFSSLVFWGKLPAEWPRPGGAIIGGMVGGVRGSHRRQRRLCRKHGCQSYSNR